MRKIIGEMDELSRVEEARSYIWIGKPASYIFITANRDGLVSLAIALLVATLWPTLSEPRPVTIDAPHLQILNSKEDVAIDWIQNAKAVPIPEENVVERRRAAWKNDRVYLLGCALVGFTSLFLIISGLILWSKIITGSSRLP